MADPFSLLGGRSTPPAGGRSGAPTARPSFIDQLMGRGSYMKEFGARRREIVQGSQQEKRRLRQDMRRNRRKYERKLNKNNRELYQQFDIRQSLRGDTGDLSEVEQSKRREKAWRKINKHMRLQERAAERDIERSRDKEIRTMRDELREGVYNDEQQW